MKNITDVQFKIEIKKIKNQYQDDLGVEMPEFRVVINNSTVNAFSKTDSKGQYIELGKAHYYAEPIHFKSLLYHEFTHVLDTAEAIKQNIPNEDIRNYTEIRAGYIEVKCKFDLFHKNRLYMTDVITLYGEESTIQSFIFEGLQEAQKIDELPHAIKSMQYLLGYLKCAEEYCKSFKADYCLRKLSEIYGQEIVELYHALKTPLEFNETNIDMCQEYMQKIFKNVVDKLKVN